MKVENKEIFANNLSFYMKQKGVDRNTLCADLDLKYTTVRDWLKGITYPRIGKIELLANYFNIKKSDLIENKTTTAQISNSLLEANTSTNKEQIAIVIGEKIKQYRLANGWTQQELGAKIGMSKNAIGNYEKGFRSPKKNTMFDLANAFNVSIDDLFPPIQKDTPPATSPIQSIYDQLEPPGQRKVITYAEKLRDEQEKRR